MDPEDLHAGFFLRQKLSKVGKVPYTKRIRENGRKKWKKVDVVGRHPIVEVFGPGPLDLLGQKMTTQVGREETAFAMAELEKQMKSAVDRVLNRKKADRPQAGETA